MRFTVGKKIGLGFGIVLFLLLTVFGITLYVIRDAKDTLNKSIEINDKFLNVEQPSVDQLTKLSKNLNTTHTYMQQWLVESIKDARFKSEANLLIDSTIPMDTVKINLLSQKWEGELKDSLYSDVKTLINLLFEKYDETIRDVLINGLDDYKDSYTILIAQKISLVNLLQRCFLEGAFHREIRHLLHMDVLLEVSPCLRTLLLQMGIRSLCKLCSFVKSCQVWAGSMVCHDSHAA